MAGGILMAGSSLRVSLVITIVLIFSYAAGTFGGNLPSMATLKIDQSELVRLETHEGEIMDVNGANKFIMREKLYLILKETDVNGKPAEQAKFTLRKGAKVKALVYRLRNKAYFVSELTIR